MTERRTPAQPRVSEHEALQNALGTLEQALSNSSSDTGAWASQMQACVRAVAGAFGRHVNAAEAPGGNIEQTTEKKPSLAPLANRLTEEHLDLLRKCERFDQQIAEQLQHSDVHAEQIQLEARIIADSVRLHIMIGAQLIYELHFRDVGGEGG